MRRLQLPPVLASRCAFAVALAAASSAAGLTPPPPKAVPLGVELEVSGPPVAMRAAPAVAAFADGGFAVAWSDLEDQTVRLRLFDRHDRTGASVAVGQSRHPRTVLARMGPDLAVLGNGSLLVVWADGSCPPGPGSASACRGRVFGRLYSRSAQPLGDAFVVSEEEGAYSGPEVAALIDEEAPGSTPRGFAVVWTVDHEVSCPGSEEGCNFSDVLGRVWSAAGEPLGPSFVVNEITHEEQNVGGVAGTADGGFVAVWESWRGEAGFFDVMRRRFDAAGGPLEGDVQVNAVATAWGRQHSPDVVALSGGGHVVAWADSTYPSYRGGDDDSIAVRAFDASGQPAGPELLASGDSHGDQGEPAVAGGGVGDFFVAWTDRCAEALCPEVPAGADGSGSGVFASYFSAAYLFGESSFDQPLPVLTTLDQDSPALASDGAGGWVAVWVSRLAGAAPATAIRARRLGFAPPCEGHCIDGRFQVSISWKDFQGNRGGGQAGVRGDDWATFWFFHPDNVELAVKVLDARQLDGRFWVFAGALTNVEYRLRVTDTATGLAVDWTNPSGTFLSRADTTTLVAASEVGDGSAAAPVATRAMPLRTQRPPSSTPLAAWATLAPCPLGTVCLEGDRFEVAATWRDFFGNQGTGRVMPLTSDTAWISFFHPGNPELVVKVLDGRPVNGHFWVFYGSLSNVEFELTVTDRATGERVVYTNPSGSFASRGDTTAFPAD